MEYLKTKLLLLFLLVTLCDSIAQVGINKDNAPAASDAILHVRGSGNQSFFIHDVSGNVGIGTLSPDQSLHVIGDIKLEGIGSGSLSDSLLVWSVADSTLKIISPTALNINSRVFSTIGNVTSNEPGDLANDDFVFGGSTLNYAGFYEDSRFFFDKSKSAFRAGRSGTFNWNEDSLGLYSAAFGSSSIASGDYSFATGSNAHAFGEAATALGRNTKALGDNSTAMGSFAKAFTDNSIAIGYFAEASGLASLAMGYDNEAIGDYSTALGNQTVASGESSFAAGRLNTTSGMYAGATGYYNTSSGEATFTSGYNNLASGDYSVAIGRENIASGRASAAFGENTSATADHAFAFGKQNTSAQLGSFSFGQNNNSNGAYSFTFGDNNDVNNTYAFAIGRNIVVNGNSGKAFGNDLISNSIFETVVGSYNESITGDANVFVYTDPLFMVGNGSSSISRSNAMLITKQGQMGIGTNDPDAWLHLKGFGPLLRIESDDGLSAMELTSNAINTDTTLFINTISGRPVTIGTQIPAAGYLLSVDGKMIAEEVRVQLSTSWPDYVFDESYQLTPLPQLEKQIKEIGHLPGIPSAAEVEADGIHLGEMEVKMMEKIEELTLHFIQLEKRLKELESRKEDQSINK